MLAAKIFFGCLNVTPAFKWRRRRSMGASTFGIAKAFKERHLHKVLRNVMVGRVAAMPDIGSRGSQVSLGGSDTLDRIAILCSLRIEVRWEAVDLLDIEDGESLQKGNRALRSSPVFASDSLRPNLSASTTRLSARFYVLVPRDRRLACRSSR